MWNPPSLAAEEGNGGAGKALVGDDGETDVYGIYISYSGNYSHPLLSRSGSWLVIRLSRLMWYGSCLKATSVSAGQ